LQCDRNEKDTGSVKREADKDIKRIIISIPPENGARINNLLLKAHARAEGPKLGASRFQVWTVPALQAERLSRRLQQLGSAVMHLPDDWNHILQLQQPSAPMSDIQRNYIDSARATPGFVDISMMNAPHAAIAEYALVIGAQTPLLAGVTPPAKAVSRIVIPINASQQVVVQRDQAVMTSKGSTWHGTVEESGEKAILMWWKDGHISGVFAYKGHIFSIVNIDGRAHAVIETDPKRMPPDHAPGSLDHIRAPKPGAAAPSSENIKPLSMLSAGRSQPRRSPSI
jgi:hypothetical protein